jgi:hypothetical protein
LRLAGLSAIGAGTVTAQYMGWGTNTSHTAAVTDTALATECVAGGGAGQIPSYARQTVTASQATTSVTNDTLSVYATLNSNGSSGVTIYECATFDATSSGNMLVYATFPGISITGTDTLKITLLLQFN